MTCYSGTFLTSEQRARLTKDELKTCILLNNYSKESDSGGGLFLIAPHDDDRAPQGVRVNSSMYGFVPWAQQRATDGELTMNEVTTELERRQAMVNVRFSENYETCPLGHRHYVTIVAAKKFKGTPENPVELIADYDHEEEDGLPDLLYQALAFVTETASDGDEDSYDPDDDPVVIFLVFLLVITCLFLQNEPTTKKKKKRGASKAKRKPKQKKKKKRARKKKGAKKNLRLFRLGCLSIVTLSYCSYQAMLDLVKKLVSLGGIQDLGEVLKGQQQLWVEEFEILLRANGIASAPM